MESQAKSTESATIQSEDFRKRRKAVVAATAGNFLEFFDWGIYGFFSVYLAREFFPGDDPLVSLILTFSTFAIGFLMRPLGALVLGAIGDSRGRRPILLFTIAVMGAGSLVIGITPGYEAIGLFAPIILVLARMAQGFSAGGEFGSAATYMAEFATPRNRAFIGSWHQVGVGAGLLVASGVAVLVEAILPQELLQEWAWRIPFVLGALISLYGLYLRYAAEETEIFLKNVIQARVKHGVLEPLRSALKNNRKECFWVFGLTLSAGITYYIWLVYWPVYASLRTGMPAETAQQINLIGLIVFVIANPFMGILSDRIGRKPMLIAYAVGNILLAFPAFLLVQNSFVLVLMTSLAGALLMSAFTGSLVAFMAEVFPTNVRTLGVAFFYAFNVAVFGGTAPLIITAFLSAGLVWAIPSYFAVIMIITLVFFVRMTETKGSVLRVN